MTIQKNGITLIALVITIIVLLILAGVTINTLVDNGIIDKTKTSTQKYKNEQNHEETQISKYENEISNYISGNRDNNTEINALKTKIEELENLNSYSETEKKIGTWYDGKPLYQKVISGKTPSSQSWQTVYTLENAKYIRMVYGEIIANNSTNDRVLIPHPTTCCIGFKENKINMYTDYTNKNFLMIVQYTKTTD